MTLVVRQTDLQGIKLLGRGKVRDLYEVGDQLLMVSTDRVSAFDVVLPDGIPDKGRILTALSVFWFDVLKDLVPGHLVTAAVERFPEPARAHAEVLRGRSMLVRRARMFPVECVVRGHLAGGGHKEYTETGAISGVRLPPGLRMADRLPEPIFTPSTKAETGHDENITFERMCEEVGDAPARRLRDLSLAIFRRGSELAARAGVLIADTKLEFGTIDGAVVLADEVLTPDSSRFWDLDTWRPGTSPPSYDKQFVRDYLESIHWDKRPPAPRLPAAIVEGTSRRYREIHERLTGRPLD